MSSMNLEKQFLDLGSISTFVTIYADKIGIPTTYTIIFQVFTLPLTCDYTRKAHYMSLKVVQHFAASMTLLFFQEEVKAALR